MHFAQFYQRSAIDASKLIEACGDRAVIILDGRTSSQEHARIAERTARERGYLGYTLHKGRLNGHSTATALQLCGAPTVGYLYHGQGTQGPFRTEGVSVRNDKPGAWQANFEGTWRRVHFQAGKTFIHFQGERIAIQIEGV